MSKKIILTDGSTAVVDANRYVQFENFARSNQHLLLTDSHGLPLARDAGEALAFVVSQLAYTENQVFERKYTPMQYEELVPLSFEAGEYADSIRYETADHAGQGKRISGRGTDIPTVDVAYGEVSTPVVNGGIGYDFSQEELRRTAFLRRPISDRKIAAAMEAYRRHMNEVGLRGEGNLQGLFNSSIVPQGNAPTGAWAGATPAQILTDINTAIQNVWTNTQFNDHVDTIVMAPTAFSFISNKPRSDNSDKTILQYVKENNIAKVQRNIDINFQPGYGLDTAGVGSTRRLIAYVKNDQRVVFHIPMPLRFLAPQMVGYLVKVPGEYKYSGVHFRYPKSAYYMDNI